MKRTGNDQQKRDWLGIATNGAVVCLILLVVLLPFYIRCTHSKLSFTPEPQLNQTTNK